MKPLELQSLQYEQNRGEFGLDKEEAFESYLEELNHLKDSNQLISRRPNGTTFQNIPYWYGFKINLWRDNG